MVLENSFLKVFKIDQYSAQTAKQNLGHKWLSLILFNSVLLLLYRISGRQHNIYYLT